MSLFSEIKKTYKYTSKRRGKRTTVIPDMMGN